MKVEKDYLDTLFEFYGIKSAPDQEEGIWVMGEDGSLQTFDCFKNLKDIFFPIPKDQEETFSFKNLKNFEIKTKENYNTIYESLFSMLREQVYKDNNKSEYSEAA